MKAKELLKTLKEKTIWAFKEVWFFLSSRVFVKNFFTAFVGVSLLLILIFALLRVYTRHGDSITLQDYSGLTLENAIDQMKAQKLKYEVIDSSLYNPELAPSTIVMQDPSPGSMVKEKRTIYFSVNASKPPMVSIPHNVWESDFKYAEAILSSKGLFVDEKNIRYRQDPAKNTVLEVIYEGKNYTKPKRKEDLIKVPKGTKLGLVVAQRGGEQTPVPKLVCLTFEEVKFMLNSSDLNIGVILPDATVSDTSTAYVYKQSPGFSEGGVIRLGEQIDIWLTQDAPAGCMEFDLDIPSDGETPDLEGMN